MQRKLECWMGRNLIEEGPVTLFIDVIKDRAVIIDRLVEMEYDGKMNRALGFLSHEGYNAGGK